MPAGNSRYRCNTVGKLRDKLAFFCIDIQTPFHVAYREVWLDYRITRPCCFEDTGISAGIVIVIHAVLWLEVAEVVRIQLTWVYVPDYSGRTKIRQICLQ